MLDERCESSEPRISFSDISIERSCEPHDRTIRAVPERAVNKDEPFRGIFLRDDASALLEPIIDQHSILAFANDHAISAQRRSTRANRPERCETCALDLPTARRQAIVRRMNRRAIELSGIVRNIEIYQTRTGRCCIIGIDVIGELQKGQRRRIERQAVPLPSSETIGKQLVP